jgi:hypothetical protein
VEGADDEHPQNIEHPMIAIIIDKPFDRPFDMIEAIASGGAVIAIDVADACVAESTLLSPASSSTAGTTTPLPPLRHR